MIEVASVRRLDARDRLDFWNDLVGSTYPGMVVDSTLDALDARLSVWHLADLRMVKPYSSSAVVTRHVMSQGRQADPKYIVHTLTRGAARLDQRGRSAILEEGDMVICASDEYYRFDAATTHEMMVVEIDSAVLTGRMPNIDDFVAQRISGKLPGTRLLRRFMDSLWQEARESMPDKHWQMHAHILSDMIVASLEASDNEPAYRSDVMLTRMHNMIAERLDDFDFGPASLARDLGVAARTLQAAAARAGTTIGKMIMMHRMKKAVKLLTSQESKSVTQIAIECGFSDPSYFARRFQQTFGTSPKKYQRYN
jgi:AraC-like DNA-binding protein